MENGFHKSALGSNNSDPGVELAGFVWSHPYLPWFQFQMQHPHGLMQCHCSPQSQTQSASPPMFTQTQSLQIWCSKQEENQKKKGVWTCCHHQLKGAPEIPVAKVITLMWWVIIQSGRLQWQKWDWPKGIQKWESWGWAWYSSKVLWSFDFDNWFVSKDDLRLIGTHPSMLFLNPFLMWVMKAAIVTTTSFVRQRAVQKKFNVTLIRKMPSCLSVYHICLACHLPLS